VIAPRPGNNVACGPKRRFSFAEKPSGEDADDPGHRQIGEADLERVEAEHALQVEGAEEEHPEHPGDHHKAERAELHGLLVKALAGQDLS
jgi:hypothetical protein